MNSKYKDKPCKIIPLGGLGEIGQNMCCFECDDTLIVVDCGIMFPQEGMPGIDFIIPDWSYVRENQNRLKGIVLTHGHEDHIGGLPFFLKEFNVPVYGSRFTLALVVEKLVEHDLPWDVEFEQVPTGSPIEIGCFQVEFIQSHHSIIDSVGLVIDTPHGRIVHSGDFTIDHEPTDGSHIDLQKYGELGREGVTVFMSDSTNSERAGYSMSERDIYRAFDRIFAESPGKIFISVFASNIGRIKQVFNIAKEYGRKVLLSGRSIESNIELAREMEYLNIDEDQLISLSELSDYPRDEIVVLLTGSQGEPRSALVRIAMDEHRSIKIEQNDTVVLSSRIIPGNERAITTMINRLYRLGADVLYGDKASEIHVSGHAHNEEQKLLLSLVKPKYFIPVHGEYRHLINHARLSIRTRLVKKDNVLLIENGDVVEMIDNTAVKADVVTSGRAIVDGKSLGDFEEFVLRDRRKLANTGMVICNVILNKQTGKLIHGPEIMNQAFTFEKESEKLLNEVQQVVKDKLNELSIESKSNNLLVQEELRLVIRRFFKKELQRKPVVIPIVYQL